jgi:hypothetical protein
MRGASRRYDRVAPTPGEILDDVLIAASTDAPTPAQTVEDADFAVDNQRRCFSAAIASGMMVPEWSNAGRHRLEMRETSALGLLHG